MHDQTKCFWVYTVTIFLPLFDLRSWTIGIGAVGFGLELDMLVELKDGDST